MKENPTQTIRAPERGPGSGGGIATRSGLHPPLEPFSQRVFDMPGGHRVYAEQVGNPGGVPVVVLHGGPGGGCSPGMRRFFDPRHYRTVLFDQRGCGRSTPNASVENNTTWDLVADIERIREALGIERWIVFGGSWGACLALLYAQAHPERVTRLVLRGVFTMTRAELDWFYGGGAGAFWPEQWQAFAQMVPAEERHDLIAAYHRRLFGADAAERVRFARAWAGWRARWRCLILATYAAVRRAVMPSPSPGSRTTISSTGASSTATSRSCATCRASRIFPGTSCRGAMT